MRWSISHQWLHYGLSSTQYHVIVYTHYNDVIMSAMASQITSLTIVYSIVYSGVSGLCAGNSPVTGEFPAQRASNAENVSIWWRNQAMPNYYQHDPVHCPSMGISCQNPMVFNLENSFEVNVSKFAAILVPEQEFRFRERWVPLPGEMNGSTVIYRTKI